MHNLFDTWGASTPVVLIFIVGMGFSDTTQNCPAVLGPAPEFSFLSSVPHVKD